MRRRDFLKATAATAASLALPACDPRGGRPGATSPSFVIIMADQLRRDVFGAYGGKNIETPSFDRMVAEGLAFDNATSSFPLCTPFRGMLMSGRYPSHSGIVINRIDASPAQNPHCLANLLSAAGYRTGFIGKWHLSAGSKGHAARFAGDREAMLQFMNTHPVEFTPPGPDRLGFQEWAAYNYHTDYKRYWFYGDEPIKRYVEGYETAIQIDQAIEFVERRREDAKPFLLVVAPHPPHPPFTPELAPDGYLDQVPERLDWASNVPANWSGRDEPLSERCYLAMVRHLDDQLGRFLDYLDGTELATSTLVTFTSDHGEMLGTRGEWGKQRPYRESIGVPLVMRWPGTIPTARSSTPHTPLEFMPTLCSLAGIETPSEASGVDLSAVLRGSTDGGPDNALIMNYVAGWVNFKTGEPLPEWRGLQTRRNTYVRWLDGGEELYDNLEDPYQLRNLAAESHHRATREALRQRTTELLAEADDEFLPGTAYGDWYDDERRLIRTALGPVPGGAG